MNKRKNKNEEAVLITIEDASRITNLGCGTIRKYAKECNAARKIGRCFRINRAVLLAYLDTFEA